MYLNYIKSILRNLVRNKYYTLINVIGLAVGMSCAIFIMLYVIDELSYDRYHEKHKRIYRLEVDFSISDRNQRVAKTPFPFGPAFKREFPQVEEYVRFRELGNTVFRYGDKEFIENRVFYTDPGIFRVFTHKFINGSPGSALDDPNSIVITESMANKYFGEEGAYGKVISLKNGLDCKVTGIIEDLPDNSHLKFDALISMISYESIIGKKMYYELNNVHFWAIRLFTYVLLKENSKIDEIHKGFPDFYDKYVSDLSKKLNGSYTLMTTALADIHLHSDLDWDLPVGDMNYIYLFFLVAIFIILIASINYMNLATAHSVSRAKEVGIRKVLGAQFSQLVRYFLTESMVLSFLALIFALFFVETFMPYFNSVSGKNLDVAFVFNPLILAVILLITIIIGLISGSYPSFYLSSIIPAVVLKERIKTGKKSGLVRRALIIFQFFISAIMVIGIIVISSQLNYLQKKDLGFNKDNILIVQLQDTTVIKSMEAFKAEIIQHPGVESFSTSTSVLGLGIPMDVMLIEGKVKMQEQLSSYVVVDYDFFDLMNMELLYGRNFNKKNKTDPDNSVIVNETAVKKFSWDKNPLGKKVVVRYPERKEYKVIGVVKDLHYHSLHNELGPLLFFVSDEPNPIMNIKIRSENQQEVLSFLERAWSEYDNGGTFKYQFLENMISEFYTAEKNLQKIFGFFTFLSIFIALLGLFSLSSYVSEQSSKEIGIRKTFGASVASIVYYLTKDFIRLVLIALFIAIPFAWYFAYKWLQTFAFSVEIKTWWFLIAGMISILIALLTVSLQAYRAAIKNPADVLKYE